MKRTKVLIRCGAVLLIIFSMLCQTITASTAPDTQSPTAPKELTVTNRTFTAISLSWTGSYDNTKVKGYQVFRDGKKITTTAKTTYTNKDLIPGRKYTYAIKAYDAVGNVSPSSIALSTTTISDSQSPSAPGDLAAPSSTFTSISLTWESSTDNVGIKGYEVYRNEKKVASTSAAYYECKRLTPGTAYTFYIKAHDKAGNYSSQSNRVSANTVSDKAAPSQPSGLEASSVTVTEVNLTWSPSSDNVKVKGYDIFRDGVKIGTTSKTGYLNKSLIPGKSYTYMVRASDISGNLSGNSSPLKVTTSKDLQAPAAPAELKVTAVNGSSVSLAWTAATDNAKVAGYQIYCNGIVITTAVRTSRIVKSPFGLGLDVYWVKAFDQVGNLSGSSNTVTAITLPG
ncbi:MAG TPA: fibronectin type III domain-containing protein [Clostridia bacterium]|nr:fibronectin type III domain-containing protein [Clostridia bacterium]